MTTAVELAVATVLAVLFVIALAPSARRLAQALRLERQRRRCRLGMTLTELQLQRLTHQAMAQLLEEARRSLADVDRRR